MGLEVKIRLLRQETDEYGNTFSKRKTFRRAAPLTEAQRRAMVDRIMQGGRLVSDGNEVLFRVRRNGAEFLVRAELKTIRRIDDLPCFQRSNSRRLEKRGAP